MQQTQMLDPQLLLQQLNLEDTLYSACVGGDEGICSPQGDVITSTNPSSGQVLATMPLATVTEYEQVVLEAQKAFTSWRMLPAPERGHIIREMGNALREKKDLLGSLVSLEMGKIKAEGDGEVQEMIDIADFAVGLSRQLYGLTMHSERPQHRMYEQWHPLGVMGIISAFNFPVAVWAWNAFIGAVCGNVSIWKPSPKTPLCSIAVQNICNEVLERHGLRGIFNLVLGDVDVGEAMAQDERIPLVSATGSTRMGKEVAKTVGGRLGKTILELGGNNAIIVDRYSDKNLVIPAVVFGAVGTAGQRCTSTRRLFVPVEQKEEICEALIAAYQQVRIGDALDPDSLMGPLIDQGSVEQYLGALEAAQQQGGEILCGGQALPSSGFFVEPAIIAAHHNMPIVHEETFAPILYVMEYETLDEAIAMQNSVKQGLSSAIFTRDIIHAETFLSHLGSDCGIANVNIGTSGAEIGGAFGGEKDTGGGRESGSDAWKGYMRRQTNTINWSSDLPLAQGIKFEL